MGKIPSLSRFILSLAVLAAASPALARTESHREVMTALGQLRSLPNAAPIAAPPPAQGRPADDDQKINFAYGEISDRMEKIVLGRGRRARRARSGVTPADRVERGEIKYIVIHSACGAYEKSIEYLLRRPQAAHFMVSRKGDVARMVEIKNIALHVKNRAIRDASIGIETETGFSRPPWYTEADWEPASAWRMYASLAWLIRAVAKEASMPRDEAHIIGHLDADRGIRGAHEDPGHYFYDKAYPAFEERFPGGGVTPRKYLMMLVNDDAPPRVERSTATAGAILRVSDSQRTGMARVTLHRLGATPPLVRQWEAPQQGLPPSQVDLTIPSQPGEYRLEAYDLVGNMTRARFLVDALAQPSALLSE